MAEQAAVLIAAMSGRALAQSARRGGYVPLVADFFADQDTLAAAEAHVLLHGNLAHGIQVHSLIQALDGLSRHRQPPLGLVYGTGFEDRTWLLHHIAGQWKLLGNPDAVVAKVKDPKSLSALCADLAIPCPEVSLTKPQEGEDWLIKRIGGSGGGHIRPFARASGAAFYYQRNVSGIPISALFLADGVHASVLGFSAQWCSPAAGKPYRYGGAVRPAPLASSMAASLTGAVARLVAAVSLIGLNSADFLVDDGRFWLLEINPRPGATLDIFEPPQGSLFALHMAACAGDLSAAPHDADGAKATAIVYADDEILSCPALDWPDWVADRPRPGSSIKAGEPLCTVYACGPAAAEARALADDRRDRVLAWMRARQP